MRITPTTITALVLLGIIQAASAVEIVPILALYRENIGAESSAGLDWSSDPKLTGEPGSLYESFNEVYQGPGYFAGTASAETNNIGPRATTQTTITTTRKSPEGGQYWATTRAAADIFYYYEFNNKGLTIDHYIQMPINIVAKGTVVAGQSQMGKANSNAGIVLTRISDTGYETQLLDYWESVGAYPTEGCQFFVSQCSTDTKVKPFDFGVTALILLEPGKPTPKLQVEVSANSVSGASGEFNWITLYPPEYDFWGGFAQSLAIMDPLITIDPTWEYAEWFDLIVSPGVVPAIVPVPAAAWLYVSGLFGLIVIARRKN